MIYYILCYSISKSHLFFSFFFYVGWILFKVQIRVAKTKWEKRKGDLTKKNDIIHAQSEGIEKSH